MRTPCGRWTDIFLAFRLALDPRKIGLAFRGLVLSMVAIGLLLGATAYLYGVCDLGGPGAYVRAALHEGRLSDAVQGTVAFAFALITGRPSVATVVPLLAALLLNLLIWAYYATAIMRLAAVEYALGERIETASATAYAARKYGAVWGSLLIPAAVAALLAVGIAFVGLIAASILAAAALLVGFLATGVAAAVASDRTHSRWAGLLVGLAGMAASGCAAVALARAGIRVPYAGEVLAALLSPLAFAAGLAIVLLLVWMLFGSALMFGTLSTSDGDAFEAWSRSYHYLFTHPWFFLFLWLAFMAYGAACMAFVVAVRVGAEWAVVGPLSAGLLGHYQVVWRATGAELVGPTAGGAQVVDFFLRANGLLLNLLVLSFWAAFKCAALTVLYFLMRQRADGTPITEVHLEPRDQQFLRPPSVAAQG